MASVEQVVPAVAGGVAARRMYVRYLLWGLLIPAVLWVLAFPLVCSRSYEGWGATEWGPVLEYPFEAGTPDADVVIWGDSSAFIGVDPRVVNRELGVRSLVLPSTVGSLPVMGDAPLRRYLARHRQPRVIVLYFSAWNLDFDHAATGRRFEGEEMMLRHGTAGEIAGYALRHPVEVAAFPVRLYSTFGTKMLLAAVHGRSRARDAAESLGHAPFNEPYPALAEVCRIPEEFLRQTGETSVEALRARYSRPGTAVMVYLAPVPRCENSGRLTDRSYAGLGAEPPVTLPPTDFAGDHYYAHVWPADVPASSRAFAAALRLKLEAVAPELLGAGGK